MAESGLLSASKYVVSWPRVGHSRAYELIRGLKSSEQDRGASFHRAFDDASKRDVEDGKQSI